MTRTHLENVRFHSPHARLWVHSERWHPPGPFNDLNPASPGFPASPAPMFGENRNVPFIFQSPPPQTNPPYPWVPPPNFSPQKAFPQPPVTELRDVDMSDLSPPKVEEGEKENGRAVSTGGLRRVYKLRQKARTQTHSRQNDEDLEQTSGDDSEDDRIARPLTQNTSNHYTLNMPSAPHSQSDMPYVLLGYLQFFFNLALVLLFLYLLVQFILTVQRDVEHRISDYSMDIVQEIGVCAAHYRDNYCETNQIPAMTHQCSAWETCMNRDPTTVGRARIGAELIAEVVNGFVEPISWKTLLIGILVDVIGLPNNVCQRAAIVIPVTSPTSILANFVSRPATSILSSALSPIKFQFGDISKRQD